MIDIAKALHMKDMSSHPGSSMPLLGNHGKVTKNLSAHFWY